MKYSPKIMGILNITPDSFYDGNPSLSEKTILKKLNKLDESDIIDVGCESSRPGSDSISAEEELNRLDLILSLISTDNKLFSIDTSKYEVAKHAVKHGFGIINDITAGKNDERIFELAAEYNIDIILMHILGTPKTMQNNPKYDSLLDDILNYFESRVNSAISYGIKEKNIILDPGIGFGKTLNDNIHIIKNIKSLKKTGHRILLGHSRKQFLQYKDDSPSDRMPSTIGVSAYAAINNIDIIRVHDVLETKSMLNTIMRLC